MAAMIPGEKVMLRGREFEIPPLTLDALERLWPRIQQMATADVLERMTIMRELIHAALEENYPDLRVDDLRKYLDMGNITAAFSVVIARTLVGKPPSTPGEA